MRHPGPDRNTAIRGAVLTLLLSLLLLVVPAWAETPGPVLTPDVGPRVEAAFARAAPTFTLQDAKIGPHQVQARACRADATCVDLVLTLPGPPCAGDLVPAWCVQFTGQRPPDAQVLLTALGGDPAPSPPSTPGAPTSPVPVQTPESLVWQTLEGIALLLVLLALAEWRVMRLLAQLAPKTRAWWTPVRRGLLHVWGAAAVVVGHLPGLWTGLERVQWRTVGLPTGVWLLVWWAVPLGLGTLIGRTLALWRGSRLTSAWSLWLPLLVVPPLGVWLGTRSPLVGAQDVLTMTALGTLTALAWCHARLARPLPWVVSGVTLVLGLAAAEGVMRAFLPPPPVVQDAPLPLVGRSSPRPDGLPVGSGDMLVDCALHATLGEETARCLRLGPLTPGAVLHLGDSMVFGSGVPEPDALPAQLAARMPGRAHVNAGVPGTSVDVHLALLTRVLAVAKPSLVVLYVMPGNDVDEVGQAAESCDAQPPLAWTGEVPRIRCPTPQWAARPWIHVLVHSRLPLPIAALTGVSWLARSLTALQHAALEPPRAHETQAPTTPALYARSLHALQAALTAAHVPLTVVLMPLRRSVYRDHTEPRRSQVQRLLVDAGVQALDLQPVLDAAVQRGGSEAAVFLDTPRGDIHLNAAGLRVVAEWLAPQLRVEQVR